QTETMVRVNGVRNDERVEAGGTSRHGTQERAVQHDTAQTVQDRGTDSSNCEASAGEFFQLIPIPASIQANLQESGGIRSRSLLMDESDRTTRMMGLQSRSTGEVPQETVLLKPVESLRVGNATAQGFNLIQSC